MTTSLARLLLALASVLAVAVAAIGLARVDTRWGPPAGPERVLQTIDAGHVPSADVATGAREILRTRPIDGHAYRALAGVADMAHKQALATSLYAIAVLRAPRDRSTRAALADRAFAVGNAAGGFEQLDALFRVVPTLAEPLLLALMPSLHDADMQDALVARLVTDPPWRNAVARTVRAPSVDPQVALDLLARLAARTALKPGEQDARIALLQQAGRDADARRFWLALADAGPAAGQRPAVRRQLRASGCGGRLRLAAVAIAGSGHGR